MRVTCDEHSRFRAGCEGCRAARRSSYAEERRASGAVIHARVGLTAPEPLGDWVNRAACAGEPSDLFFPDPGKPATEAKAICADCPVKALCLDHALTHHEDWGVWGGMSEKERKTKRRRDRRNRAIRIARETA